MYKRLKIIKTDKEVWQVPVPAIKNINTNFNAKGKTNPVCLTTELIPFNDAFIKTKKNMNVSFTSLLGANGYGAQEDRDALGYKLQLTPPKINNIMQEAKSTDEGLMAVHKMFLEETAHIKQAFLGFKAINQQYLFFSNQIMGEIMNSNPKGAKIPVVNQITLPISNFTGSFQKKIINDLTKLFEDHDEIAEKYVNKGLYPMVNDYSKISTYIQDGIEYVNMRQGNSPIRDKILENVANYQETYEDHYIKLKNAVENQVDRIQQKGFGILENQAERQGERVNKMAIKKLARWVMILAGS